VQATVQVPVPAGAVEKTTDAMPRSEAAVAASGTEPRSGVPGLASTTATVLKSAAELNCEPGLALPATKVASDSRIPTGIRTASTSSPIRARVRRFDARRRRLMSSWIARGHAIPVAIGRF
jgi:hypothetical protein